MLKPPGSYFQIKTLNGAAVVSSNVGVAGRSVAILGLEVIPLDKIVGINITNYSAGTASKRRIAFTTTPGVIDNTPYTFTVQRTNGDITSKRSYIVMTGVSDTGTVLALRCINAVLGDPGAYLTPSQSTSNFDMLMNDTDSDFSVDFSAFPIATMSVVTPYVAPAGTTAIMQKYDPLNYVSSGTYRTYEITYQRKSNDMDENIVGQIVTSVVFADENTANVTAVIFGAFDAKMKAALLGLFSQLGALPTIIDGAGGAISAVAGLAVDQKIVMFNCTTSAYNLPDSATFGDGIIIVINDGSGSCTVGKVTGGDTLIGTNSTTLTTLTSAIYVNTVAKTLWARII